MFIKISYITYITLFKNNKKKKKGVGLEFNISDFSL